MMEPLLMDARLLPCQIIFSCVLGLVAYREGAGRDSLDRTQNHLLLHASGSRLDWSLRYACRADSLPSNVPTLSKMHALSSLAQALSDHTGACTAAFTRPEAALWRDMVKCRFHPSQRDRMVDLSFSLASTLLPRLLKEMERKWEVGFGLVSADEWRVALTTKKSD